MEYFLITALIIALIGNLILITLIKNKLAIKLILNILAGILIIWKVSEFTYYAVNHIGVYPVEFSHIAYFIVGIFVLSQCKRLYFTAGIYGLISSLGYIFTVFVSPTTVIANHSELIVLMGLASHVILLITGSLILFTIYKFDWIDFLISIGFLIINYIYLILINYGIIYKNLGNPNGYFAIKLIKGNLFEYLGVTINNRVTKFVISGFSFFVISGLIAFLKFVNNGAINLKSKIKYYD